MKQVRIRQCRQSRRGGALLIAILATLALAGMGAAMMAMSGSSKKEGSASVEKMRSLYVAEAGVSEAILDVNRNGIDAWEDAGTSTWGSEDTPNFSSGTHWGEMAVNGDGTVRIKAHGASQGQERAIEAVILAPIGGIYDNALFAGNSDGDPLYDLEFGGVGTQGDAINGDIYSGGNIVVSEGATVSGIARAEGTVSGMAGDEGVDQPTPDIPGMNYATNHDFDVASMFAGATYESNSLGGSAYQLPESSPAHIFRKNPSDRSSDTSGTVKDDYFLEDPYESVSSSSSIIAERATQITISGLGGAPGASGNDAVYYIDGNLWVHNKKIFSFAMHNSGSEDIRVTFVVKGNIYFSDNVLYEDTDKDGVAFIAIKDEDEPESGDIYFGDPVYGTLEQMDAYMFAENDFRDTNLSDSGSATVTVNGNMTAGNQVLIERDFDGEHSKLTVNFDDRVASGELMLPGLPTSNSSVGTWSVVSWREVSVQ
ncbi:MAG: hypothetical protein ACI8X5_003039 [Planctomycetota bacterium]|jgi:hypothetical protein